MSKILIIEPQDRRGTIWNAKGDLQSIPNMNYLHSVNVTTAFMSPHRAIVDFHSDGTWDYTEGNTSNLPIAIYDWVDHALPGWGMGGNGGASYTINWPTPTVTSTGSNNTYGPASAGSSTLVNPSLLFSVGALDTGDIQVIWTNCYITNDAPGAQVNDPEYFNITLRAISQY